MARKALTLSAEYTQLKRLGCSMLVYVSYSFTWEKDVKPRLKFKQISLSPVNGGRRGMWPSPTFHELYHE